MTKSHLRIKENQNWWNGILMLFFIGVILCVLAYFQMRYGGFPQNISLFGVVIITLASFRITRLVVYDKVTRFFREWFVQKREVQIEGKTWVEIKPYTHGFLATVHELVTCPWCIGMWSALVVTFCYFAFSWSWFVILFLAIAGVTSFIQILANVLGWKAESLKLDVRAKEDVSL